MNKSKRKIRISSVFIILMVLIMVSFTSCRDARKERLVDFKSPTYEEQGLKSENKNLENKIVSLEKELEDRISKLEKELQEKENEIGILKDAEKINVTTSDSENNENEIVEGDYYLRKAPLKLYRNIINENNEITIVGAWGPRAIIQMLYEGESEESLKVIEIKDGIAKIYIEGYIPSWYLTRDNDDQVKCERKSNMYVISDSAIRIAPQEEAQIAQKVNGGTAVRILESYGEWYFAEVILPGAAEPLNEGWIKQEDLGYLKDVLEFREKNQASYKENNLYGIDVKVKVEAQELDYDGKVSNINKYEYWGSIVEIK